MIRRFVALARLVALSRIASAAVTAGKPGHARVPASSAARTLATSPAARSASSSCIASCACTNAYSNASRAMRRRSSLRSPQDAAASAYSRDRLVSNTPGSSVARTNGWPAPCTLVRWCRAAADAADVLADFFVGVLSTPPSASTESVTTLLVMHSSTGIFEARSCAHRVSSRVVKTQCPSRSGLNRSIAASSPRAFAASPQ